MQEVSCIVIECFTDSHVYVAGQVCRYRPRWAGVTVGEEGATATEVVIVAAVTRETEVSILFCYTHNSITIQILYVYYFLESYSVCLQINQGFLFVI